MVLTSSSVTCGSSPGPLQLDETGAIGDEWVPDYFRTKAQQEEVATEVAAARGVELVVACPTVVLGGPDWRLVPSNAVLVRYLLDPSRTTYPGGCNVVAVGDVARGHVLLAEGGVPGERYLLGGEDCGWRTLHSVPAERGVRDEGARGRLLERAVEIALVDARPERGVVLQLGDARMLDHAAQRFHRLARMRRDRRRHARARVVAPEHRDRALLHHRAAPARGERLVGARQRSEVALRLDRAEHQAGPADQRDDERAARGAERRAERAVGRAAGAIAPARRA